MSTEPTGDGVATNHAPPFEVESAHSDVLKLFTVLFRAHATLQARAREDVARHGLTLGEFAVLEVLYHKGPLLLGAIREKVLVSSGGMTYLVDRLARRNLVERRDCPGDRRARFAALTPEGISLMKRIFPEHARCLTRAMASLGADERETMIRLLRSLGRGALATSCGDDQSEG